MPHIAKHLIIAVLMALLVYVITDVGPALLTFIATWAALTWLKHSEDAP